jgi:hypothetical protein
MIYFIHRAALIAGLLVLAWSSQEAESPKSQKPAEVYWVPYRLSDVKHVVVRVKLNGKGPFNFIVDTGAPAVYVGTETAKEIGINLDGKEGADHTFDLFEIEGGPKMTAYQARVENPFQLTGMNKINAAGIKYHGVLGYTILSRYEIEYDFTRPHLKWTKLDWDPPPPPGFRNLSKGASDQMKTMMGLSLLATSLLPRKPDAIIVYRGLVGIEVAEKNKQVVITHVLADTPAAAAGLQVGDRIVEFRDKAITSLLDLEKEVLSLPAEKEIEIVIERAGAEKTIHLTPGRGF